jgi:hypothetical protein
MKHQSTPNTDAFRSLVHQAGALQTEISTLDAAIRERDAIRARMAECSDEAEARKHLGDLTRAEETVTVKEVRLPRQQAELAELLTRTEEAFHATHAEVEAIIMAAPKEAVAAFRDLLHAAQLDPEERKVEQANPVVVDAIRPHALAKLQEDTLHEAWRAVALSDAPLQKRVEGFKNSLAWFEKALVGHVEIAAEDKRMVAACEAFRKALAKG